MKTKLAVGLVLVLILTVSLGLTGCKGIATGGGFLQEDEKVTFGFNAQVTVKSMFDYTVKGQFQLVDHNFEPPMRIHGTFNGGMGSFAWGRCKINGEGSYKFYLYVEDAGEPGVDDYIWVKIKIPGPDIVYEGTIDGGNIQVHEIMMGES